MLILGGLIYYNKTKYDGDYKIVVEKIDSESPDRHLKVLRNNKETKDYKHIIYKKGDIEAILCYVDNPSVNVFSIDVDKLTIVLPNDKEVEAKVIREDK